MKKLLIALLALSVAGTAVFAADPALTFSGALKTGLQFTSSDEEGVIDTDGDGEDIEKADGAVSLYSDDAEKALRLELVGAYTDGDFGVKFRLRADGQASLNFSYGYAWGNLFNNMVTFKVGKVDDGAWATEGDEGFDVADGNGLQIQVKPMAGLNVGIKLNATAIAGVPVNPEEAGIDMDADGEDDVTFLVPGSSARAMTYAEFFSESALGLGYTSDLFNFQAGYQMDSAYDDEKDADYDANAYAMAYFGASYKGMKALTAKVEGRLGALGAADYSWKEFNEVVEYAVNDQISAGIVLWQTMFSEFYDDGATKDPIWGDLKDDGLLYSVKPYANYKLNDKTTLGLAVTYAAQGDATDITVKPSATVQLAPKAKFVGFYSYNTADSGLKGADPVNTSKIQLDFIYSF